MSIEDDALILGITDVAKFMIVTFLMLGWAFYELSGGADFVPETREMAQAETTTEEPLVTRSASTASLISLSMPARIEPQPEPAVEAEVVAAITEAVADASDELIVQEASVPADATELETVAPETAVEEAPTDLRLVDASRVNMRQGPGTAFNVIAAFDRGTQMEVLQVDPSGWAEVRVLDTGETGWMAERLLTEG